MCSSIDWAISVDAHIDPNRKTPDTNCESPLELELQYAKAKILALSHAGEQARPVRFPRLDDLGGAAAEGGASMRPRGHVRGRPCGFAPPILDTR